MKPDLPSIELSEEESIARLLALTNRQHRVRGKQGPAVIQGNSRSARRRCSCGRCRPCRDNARWEQIFEEKFADPTYYTLRPIRMSSPLA